MRDTFSGEVRGNADRPGLDQALAALQEGDTFVVATLDRLGEVIAVYAKNGSREQPAAAARRRAPGIDEWAAATFAALRTSVASPT